VDRRALHYYDTREINWCCAVTLSALFFGHDIRLYLPFCLPNIYLLQNAHLAPLGQRTGL